MAKIKDLQRQLRAQVEQIQELKAAYIITLMQRQHEVVGRHHDDEEVDIFLDRFFSRELSILIGESKRNDDDDEPTFKRFHVKSSRLFTNTKLRPQ